MQDFKNLKVWRKSHDLTLEVFRSTRAFPAAERFSLGIQMRKSALSVESNIAEGSARGGDVEFRRFAFMALASACELESQLLVARDLEFIPARIYEGMNARGSEIRRMLWSLIQRLSGA